MIVQRSAHDHPGLKAEIQQDPNGWFDCSTGQSLTPRQAATFDSRLEGYLTKFQLDNQFYIMCYLFAKFGIPKIISQLEKYEKEEDESWLDFSSWEAGSSIFESMGLDSEQPDIPLKIILKLFCNSAGAAEEEFNSNILFFKLGNALVFLEG